MLFVAALLPVIIYIFMVYKIDNFSLINVKNLFLQVLCGMVAALACLGLFQFTGSIFSENQCGIGLPRPVPVYWVYFLREPV